MVRITPSLYKDNIEKHIVFLAFFALMASFLLVSTPSFAQSDAFVVENVRVDVTASNAVEAREQAFEAAQIKAYEKLAARMLSAEELEEFETPPLSRISSLVKNFEVTNEQLSSVRYNGTYMISFRPHSLGSGKAAVGNSNVFSNQQTGSQLSTLVIPVIQKDGRSYIWSRGPYRDAWIREISQNDSQNIILPVGDSEDRSMVRDDEALNYDFSRLERLIQKYQADKAVFVVTNPQSSTQNIPSAQVDLYEASRYGPQFIRRMDVPAYPGEMPAQLFGRVASQAKMILENQIEAPQVVEVPEPVEEPLTGPSKTLTAQLGFSSVREWVDLKRGIEKTRGVSSVLVKSMSARKAVIDVTYRGEERLLAQNLNQMRIHLSPPQAYTSSYGQPHLYTIKRMR